MIGVEPNQKETLNINTQKEFNFGLVYIGFLIIFFGALLSIDPTLESEWSNFEVLISFADLWGLVLMFAGLSLLKLKGWTGNIVGCLVVLGCVGLTGLSILNFDGDFRETVTEPFSIQNPLNLQQTNIDIQQTAGKITVQGGLTGRNFMSGFFESNFSSVSLDYSDQNTNEVLEANITETSFWEGIGNYFKNLTIQLNTGLTQNITFQGDATRGTFDLTDLQVNSLTMDLQASDALVTLGANQPVSTVDIDTAASSVTIIVPADAGLRINTEQNISFVNLPETIVQVSETEFQTPLYVQSVQKINLNIDSQFSRISIVQNPL